MKKPAIIAVDWNGLKNGSVLKSKIFDNVMLVKLDNSNAIYMQDEEAQMMVSIETYESPYGTYQYFKRFETDWSPITIRDWQEQR